MYDDSDVEEEEGEESEEEVERLLLEGEEEEGESLVEASLTLEVSEGRSRRRDGADSFAQMEDSPAALAAVRTSDRAVPGDVDSPLPAPKTVVPMLGADLEEEDEDESDSEEENDEGLSEEFEVPLKGESSMEEAESDNYVEEDDEASEDDYAPAPTAGRKSRGSAASTKASATKARGKKVVPASSEYDVSVEIQSKPKKKVVRASVEEEEEIALDKSIVIRPGASKKPKRFVPLSFGDQRGGRDADTLSRSRRKLGGHKIKDVEDLDQITDTFSPVVTTSKPLTKSASIRSLNRR